VNDAIGRKKTLIGCAVLFAVSAVGSAIPTTLNEFVWYRFIGGVGVGAVSMTSPLYIAEISPEHIRGRLVSLYQLAIVSGILLVFFINTLIQRMGDESWNVATGWRWMFGSETLPAVLFGAAAFFVPECPRGLVLKGRVEQALKTLTRFGGATAAGRQMASIESTLTQTEVSLSQLFVGRWRIPLMIGIVLAVCQQFSGINAIMYYAPEIFKSIGSTVDSAFVNTVSVGAVNLVFTIVAIYLVDKVGRRALLLAGTAVQVIALAAVGWLFKTGGNPMLLLAFILLFVAAFAVAMGPVAWIVISEIFPNRVRGRAMSIATLVLWTACYLVSQTFPMLVEGIGSSSTFWVYAGFSLLSFIFVWKAIPETKGRTLEEIEESWQG
jgi:SP family arabinose:H+ symporter-like MFS transporter